MTTLPPCTWKVDGTYPEPGSGRGVNPPRRLDKTTELRRWVKDADWIYRRAALCLQDALARLNANPPLKLPGSIKNILDGLLGDKATVTDYQAVLGRLRIYFA